MSSPRVLTSSLDSNLKTQSISKTSKFKTTNERDAFFFFRRFTVHSHQQSLTTTTTKEGDCLFSFVLYMRDLEIVREKGRCHKSNDGGNGE